MEENQSESAATGCGRVGTDHTTSMERVAPSSLGAAGDRLPVHLSSSKNTACLADTRTPAQSSDVPVEEPGQGRETQFLRKKEGEQIEFEAWLDFRNFPDLSNEFQE